MNLHRKPRSGQKSWKKLVGTHRGDQEREEEGVVITLNSAETPRVVRADNVNCMGDVKVSCDLRQSAFKGMDLQHFLWWDVTLCGVDT